MVSLSEASFFFLYNWSLFFFRWPLPRDYSEVTVIITERIFLWFVTHLQNCRKPASFCPFDSSGFSAVSCVHVNVGFPAPLWCVSVLPPPVVVLQAQPCCPDTPRDRSKDVLGAGVWGGEMWVWNSRAVHCRGRSRQHTVGMWKQVLLHLQVDQLIASKFHP